MEWTFAPCACCNGDVLVPGNVARRVRDGVSHVVCEACMDNAVTAEDVGGGDEV